MIKGLTPADEGVSRGENAASGAWGLCFIPHAIAGAPSARWQNNPAALLQFDQQAAGRHVFELPDSVAPIPQPCQLLTKLLFGSSPGGLPVTGELPLVRSVRCAELG